MMKLIVAFRNFVNAPKIRGSYDECLMWVTKYNIILDGGLLDSTHTDDLLR